MEASGLKRETPRNARENENGREISCGLSTDLLTYVGAFRLEMIDREDKSKTMTRKRGEEEKKGEPQRIGNEDVQSAEK